jgi:hypothetical protein
MRMLRSGGAEAEAGCTDIGEAYHDESAHLKRRGAVTRAVDLLNSTAIGL